MLQVKSQNDLGLSVVFFNNIQLSIPHICISVNILLAIGNKVLGSINIIDC